VAERIQGQLLKEWSELTIKIATKLGLPIDMAAGVPCYDGLSDEMIDKIGFHVQPHFLARLATLGVVTFSWIGEIEDLQHLRNALVSSWRQHFDAKQASDLYGQIVVKMGERDTWKETHRVHHLRPKYSSKGLTNSPIASMRDIVTWAICHVNNGVTPVISLEEATNAEIVALGYALVKSELSPQLGYKLKHGIAVSRVSERDLKEFDIGKWFSCSAIARADEARIMWHCDGDLFFRVGPAELERATQGTLLISWDTFDFQYIAGVVEYLCKLGKKVFLHPLKFFESQAEFLILYSAGGRIYFCWRSTRYDYVRLKNTYEGNDQIVMLLKGDVDPQQANVDDLLLLLEIAYLSPRGE
jgi:hypothetical protein